MLNVEVNSKNIRGIQASLRYLSIEAESAGLMEIAVELRQTATKCLDDASASKQENTHLEEDIANATRFLNLFSKASRSVQQHVAKRIANEFEQSRKHSLTSTNQNLRIFSCATERDE